MRTFLSKHWISLLLIGVLIYILLFNQGRISELEEESAKKELKIINLKELVKKQEKELIKLAEIDTIYLDSIVYIKEIIYEDVISVDTMSVSELQNFFSGRYPEKGNSN